MTATARPWVVYVRVSDEDQLKGLSLEAQRDTCIAFLRSMGHEHHEVVQDPGFSAFGDDAIFRRPGMRGILGRVERREIAGIIAWKTDRVARSLYDLLTLAKRLREHDAALLIVVEQINTAGPNGNFLMQLHGMLAERSSEDTSARVKASFRQKVQRGEWLGGMVPPGCVVAGDVGRRRLERCPEKGPIVERIWTLVAQGMTLSQVGEYLRGHGLLPYNGSRRRAGERKPRVWTRQTVLNLLRSKAMVGVLVDDRTRDLALAALATRFAPGRSLASGAVVEAGSRPSDRVWRLARLARCALCGATLVGIHARGKSGTMYPYLRCSNRAKSKHLCPAADLAAATWEAAVIEAVATAVAEGGQLVKQLGAELKERRASVAGLAERRGELTRQADAIRQRIERVAMLVADGDAAGDAVKPLLVKMQGEAKATERLLSAVEGELMAAEMTAGDIDRMLLTIGQNVASLPSRVPDHQAAILAALVAEVRLAVDHPIGLTLWWDDRVFVHASKLAPRDGRKTNTRTVSVSIPVTMVRVPVSNRGGCRWKVVVERPAPAPTS